MKRDYWIDQIKIMACCIVVLAHFIQSMMKVGILQDGQILKWFFIVGHASAVQLFFFSSGFLYQKYSRVDDAKTWLRNVIKKLIMLGIPYFFFSGITWIMKNLSPDDVNQAPKGLVHSLFVIPIGQYWYLFILFFMFLLTPTIQSRKTAALMLGTAFLMKLISILSGDAIKHYLIGNLLGWYFWFVLGMVFVYADPKDVRNRRCGSLMGGVCLLLSIIALYIRHQLLDWVLALTILAALVLLMYGNEKGTGIVSKVVPYTMPVFLMHTIFAACIRIVLMRFGIFSLAVHAALGLTVSVLGPVIATIVMQKMHLDWLIDPRPVQRFIISRLTF